jgi:hypothetical protein
VKKAGCELRRSRLRHERGRFSAHNARETNDELPTRFVDVKAKLRLKRLPVPFVQSERDMLSAGSNSTWQWIAEQQMGQHTQEQ